MSRRRQTNKSTIKLDVHEPWNGKKGHTEHQSGSGQHQDRRTKRQRTRSNQIKTHLEEME